MLKSIGIIASNRSWANESAQTVIHSCELMSTDADRLGYSRIWIPEHHAVTSAWASPSAMLCFIAAKTNRIVVGTATIILSLRPVIEIADSFAFLTTTFPGRIDCGIGGANMDPLILDKYNPGAASVDHYISRTFEPNLRQLHDYFTPIPNQHGWNGITPAGAPAPDLWVMAVSGSKRHLAAATGSYLCYSIYHQRSKCDPAEISLYYSEFQPSRLHRNPKAVVAVNVACAETTAEANAVSQQLAERKNPVSIFGTPTECIEQLNTIATRYGVDEILIKYEGGTCEEQRRGCKLLGEEFYRTLK